MVTGLGRKRKKKCDERRPVCSQCTRHHNSMSECTWTRSPTSQSWKPHIQKEQALLLDWRRQENTKSVHGDSNHRYNGSKTVSPSTVRLFTPRSYLKEISPEVIEGHLLQVLFSRCEELASNSFFHQDLSFPSLLLPQTISNPTTKSAVLACGAVLLANYDVAWVPMSQYYHTQTIHIIQTSLMSSGREQNLSAIMLLHLYEVRSFTSQVNIC